MYKNMNLSVLVGVPLGVSYFGHNCYYFFFNSETNLLFHKKYIQRVNKYLYLTLKFYFILWYYLHSFFIKYHFDHFFFSGSICSLRLSPCDWCFESFISKWCLHRISSGRFRTSSPLSTRRSIWSMLH